MNTLLNIFATLAGIALVLAVILFGKGDIER
jgi:hypothetical protein